MSVAIDRRDFLRVGGAALATTVLGRRSAFAQVAHFGWSRWALDDAFLAELPARMAEAGVPGISIAYGAPGATPLARGFGVASAGLARAVDPSTVFPAGSLSKAVLATIALELEDRGAFELDRPLREWLPGADFPTGPGAERLTARHALRHVTGLPNWRFSVDTLFALEAEPGARWGYSGEGYFLVQRAVEAASGRGLEGLARALVFGPLGMRSSTFLWREDLADRLAHPTTAADDRMAHFADYGERRARAVFAWARDAGRDPVDIRYEDMVSSDATVRAIAETQSGRPLPEVGPLPIVLTPNAAGSLWTTPSDYLRFLHAWLQHEDWRERAFRDPVAAGERIGWGAGWGLELVADPPPFWHWGEGVGFRCFALADVRAGEGIVVLTNADGGSAIGRLVVEAATAADHPAFDFV